MEEKRITKITPSQFKKGLATRRNMLVYGPSGYGKTAIVYEYAEENNLKVMNFDLVSKLVEEVGGIPAVIGDYYKRTMDIEMKEFFDAEGEGYILFFDEVNQGQPETLNTLYTITHPNPAMRRWAGHNIGKCQIVACGNLNDGRDKTVYLTELPTPLENRFFVFELEPSKKDATDWLKKKWKNIPQVAKYIKEMLDNKIAPRDIDLALDILQYEQDPMFLEAKLGEALTRKILDLQKGIKGLDPAELIKNARKVYNKFKEDGYVEFGMDIIRSEDELRAKFSEYLSDEEIAGVMKGDE